MLVVCLGLSDFGLKVCIFEIQDEVLAQKLKFLELCFLIIDLSRVSHDALSKLLVVLVHLVDLIAKVVVVHPCHLLVALDLGIMVAV